MLCDYFIIYAIVESETTQAS